MLKKWRETLRTHLIFFYIKQLSAEFKMNVNDTEMYFSFILKVEVTIAAAEYSSSPFNVPDAKISTHSLMFYVLHAVNAACWKICRYLFNLWHTCNIARHSFISLYKFITHHLGKMSQYSRYLTTDDPVCCWIIGLSSRLQVTLWTICGFQKDAIR